MERYFRTAVDHDRYGKRFFADADKFVLEVS